MNRIPITEYIKKKPCGTGRRGRGAEPAGPTPMVWQLRIERDISAVEVSNEEGSKLPNSGINAEKRSPHVFFIFCDKTAEIMC